MNSCTLLPSVFPSACNVHGNTGNKKGLVSQAFFPPIVPVSYFPAVAGYPAILLATGLLPLPVRCPGIFRTLAAVSYILWVIHELQIMLPPLREIGFILHFILLPVHCIRDTCKSLMQIPLLPLHWSPLCDHHFLFHRTHKGRCCNHMIRTGNRVPPGTRSLGIL